MFRLSVPYRLVIGLRIAMLACATSASADEVFREVHHEPITIRVLHGKDGRPLPRAHLTLVAGYDDRDLRLKSWRAEALTNQNGEARLPNALVNFPFLRIWVTKKGFCHGSANKARFSVERIRSEGFSASNHCGTVVVEDAPGIFTVFVKGKGSQPPAELARPDTPITPTPESSAPAVLDAERPSITALLATVEAGSTTSSVAGKAAIAALRLAPPAAKMESLSLPIDLARYFGLSGDEEAAPENISKPVTYSSHATMRSRPHVRRRAAPPASCSASAPKPEAKAADPVPPAKPPASPDPAKPAPSNDAAKPSAGKTTTNSSPGKH